MKNLFSDRDKLCFYMFASKIFSIKSSFSLSLSLVVSVCFLVVLPGVVLAQSRDECHRIYIKEAADGDVFGNSNNENGSDDTLDPNNNCIEVSNNVNGSVFGGYAEKGSANNNSVIVQDGNIKEDVIGGRSENGANNNSVTINGGTIKEDVVGGIGTDSTGSATNNSVTINGGTIKEDVIGGWTKGGVANNNSVTINGGTIERNVVGGMGTDSTGNTLKISGNVNFNPENSVISGGINNSEKSDAGNFFTGNKLIIDTKRIEVRGVRNFEYYDFYLPENIKISDAILTAKNGGGRGEPVDLNNVTISLYAAPGKPLIAGSKYLLIRSLKGFSEPLFHKNVHIKQGYGTIVYDSEVVAEGELLVANVSRIGKLNPQAKAFSEGRAASITFIGQGSELIADKGISAAAKSLGSTSNTSDIAIFTAGVGGKSRYKTGSHIDVTGASLVVGVAKGFKLEDCKVIAGAFIEHGDGKYKSLNTITFDDIKKDVDVKANGIVQYTGGGLLGRIDFSNNFYAEVSGRAGSATKNNFHSDDVKFNDEPASYDYDGVYLGAHMGGGYVYEINNKLELDASGKYFFTYQGSKDVELSTKEIIKFAGTSLHKIRLGAKLTYKAAEVFKPYIGGAFEYELAGKVNAALAGFDVDAPTLKGGSGIGEFGVTANVGKFLIDLGGRGYAGARTGIDGMLKVKYTIGTRKKVPSPRRQTNTAALPADGLRYTTSSEANDTTPVQLE